jgi:hypothetical protein
MLCRQSTNPLKINLKFNIFKVRKVTIGICGYYYHTFARNVAQPIFCQIWYINIKYIHGRNGENSPNVVTLQVCYILIYCTDHYCQLISSPGSTRTSTDESRPKDAVITLNFPYLLIGEKLIGEKLIGNYGRF